MARALHFKCGMRNFTLFLMAVFLMTGSSVLAKEVQKKPVAAPAAAKAKAPTNKSVAAASSPQVRTPAALDSNRAVEIRGQSRTLSMMLVLKNGKENINFIKVRKDYNPEISNTPY